MSLDLHVHTEVNVGILLLGGHGGVLHWVYVHAVQIYTKGERETSAAADERLFECRRRRRVVTFDANSHVRIDALPRILQPNFFYLYCQ